MFKTVRKGDPAKALVREENAPALKKIPKGCVPVKDSLRRLSAYLNLLRRQQIQTDSINPNSFFKLITEYDIASEVVDASGNPRFNPKPEIRCLGRFL